MRFRAFGLYVFAPAILISVGCAPVDSGLGEALRYDMALQTIDPDPQYPADAMNPGSHGEKAQKATERYRKGQTKALRIERSTSGVGTGSGN